MQEAKKQQEFEQEMMGDYSSAKEMTAMERLTTALEFQDKQNTAVIDRPTIKNKYKTYFQKRGGRR